MKKLILFFLLFSLPYVCFGLCKQNSSNFSSDFSIKIGNDCKKYLFLEDTNTLLSELDKKKQFLNKMLATIKEDKLCFWFNLSFDFYQVHAIYLDSGNYQIGSPFIWKGVLL